jgi:hypothetical protein
MPVYGYMGNIEIHPIQQRKAECSLAVLCQLNGFTQQTYEMISNKLRNEGYTFVGKRKAAIARMMQLFKQLGKMVPAGFGTWQTVPGDDQKPLQGKGVIYMSMFMPRKRKPTVFHVVCYEDGAIIDTYQQRHKNWAAYVVSLKALGWGRVRIEAVYPA